MAHRAVQTDQAPAAIGPYSQGIIAGEWLFVSGQIGMVPETGELVSQELEGQARQALENVKQIVLAAGFDLTEVVAVDVFLTDLKRFADFNQIYAEVFTDHRPARAAVEVSTLPRGACVEIKCMARRGAK